jgi:ATP-dependent DNA ligase
MRAHSAARAIKHDGFRILERRDESGVRLFSRNGYDFADHFSLLPARKTQS